MDLIINFLMGLYKSLTPIQFVALIVIVLCISASIIIWYIKMSNTGNGLLGFLTGKKLASAKDAEDITAKIDLLSNKLETVNSELKDLIQRGLDAQRDRTDTLHKEISKTFELKEEINDLYAKLNTSIEDLKTILRLRDAHEQHTAESLRHLLQQSLDAIRNTYAQLEKIDDYIRDQVPQFRSNSKEFARELNDISRDLALIERSIQTQINTVGAVKLRL